MNNNSDKNYGSEFKILNQFLAAQLMLHEFNDETKLGEFIVNAVIEIPAIEGCAIFFRSCTCVNNISDPEFSTITATLKNTSDNQDHFSIGLQKKENQHIFSIKTLERSFGYLFLTVKNCDDFEIFKPAINNFINMIAMDMENQWQKLHIEKLVEKRTVELKEELSQCKKAEKAIKESELHYRNLFIESPVPLWEEDFSNVKKYIDELKKRKVKDFGKYFDDNPDELIKIAGLVKFIDVNNATLKLYEAESKEELMKDLNSIFTEDSYIAFKEELVAIAMGKTKYNFEGVVKTLKGNLRHIQLGWRVLPGYENSYEKVFISTIDFTDKKNMAEKVFQEKNKAQQYLNIADVMMVSIDSSGIVKLINPKGCKVLGYSEDEIVGQNWFDKFLPERLRENVKKVSKKVFAGEMESVDYYENEILTKNGNERLIAWHNAVYKDDNGKIIGTLSSGEDITERKQSEKLILESEKKYRLLTTNTLDTIWATDMEFNMTFVNSAILNFLGYTPEEFIGLNTTVFTTAEGIKTIKNAAVELVVNLQQGRTNQTIFELQQIRKDGSLIDVEIRANILLDDKGNFIGFQGRSVDITERKTTELKLQKSEDRLSKTLIASNDGMWDWNLITNDTYFDPQYFKMAGYDIDEFPHNLKEFQERTHPDDINHVMKNVQLHIEGKTQHYNIEFRFKKKNGNWLWLLGRGKIVEYDKNKKPTRFIGTHTDITKRKLAEEALFENEKKYRSLFENINVGSALHEIILDENNNPIDFIWLDVNPAYEKLTQLKYSDIIGKRGLEIIPNLEKRWIDIYGKVALTGKSESLTDYSEYLNKHWEVKAYSPKKNQFAVALTDITDRKLADEELTNHREHLEQLVIKRTEELEEKNQELDNTLKIFVGREYKINELQKRIRLLEGE